MAIYKKIKMSEINMASITLEDILKETVHLNVLYVEDAEETRIYTLKMLQNFFSKVSVCTDGQEGLNAFENEKFDLIFTDINMPNMNGLQMIENIRKTDIDIPIVIFSAYDDKECLLEGIKLGIDGYVLKPFDYDEVEAIITKISKKISNIEDKKNIIIFNENLKWNILEKKLFNEQGIIKLTKNELALIKLFTTHKSRIYSAIDIESYIFDDNISDNSRVRNLLSRLKKKLQYELIESIYAEGYRLKLWQ